MTTAIPDDDRELRADPDAPGERYYDPNVDADLDCAVTA